MNTSTTYFDIVNLFLGQKLFSTDYGDVIVDDILQDEDETYQIIVKTKDGSTFSYTTNGCMYVTMPKQTLFYENPNKHL